MIDYQYFTLENGLKVYVLEDHTSAMAVVNILYNVGSRDEQPDKTGFAHLFEHLMFGGSKNIPSYDVPLQQVGGENNAFTSPDITNYYITLPSANLETAFWLESDRMLSLSFDPKVLEVQRQVVIEEFKQRYLNQPYGDVWLKLRPLTYQVHPYRWATIGKEIAHIEQATMEDVKGFFYKYYLPNNALMVVAGDVTLDQVKKLSEKWFGPIPAGKPYQRQLPQEPWQTASRKEECVAKVPLDAIYKTFHMPERTSPRFHACDLMSDVLGRGKSSRLYRTLVNEQKLFNSINAHVTSSLDPGLIVVEGKLNKGISFSQAEEAIQQTIQRLREEKIKEEELTKVKNQAESTLLFSEVELLERAMALAFAANMGNADLVNEESSKIQAVTAEAIWKEANEIFDPNNCSTLYYKAE